MDRATILIPTHNHARLLLPAVRSALAQTHQDFEIFIIGDGITPETRAAIAEAQALDPRIRFFDHEKSLRTGEPYRHEALTTAAIGDFVCYLSDDDLWFPDHLATMRDALRTADLAHALPLLVDGAGTLLSSLVDLSLPEWAQWTIAGHSKNSLSFVAHRLDFYRRLPHGWRTTPQGRPTDNYMWAQMLEMPGIRATSTGKYTALGFPHTMRRDWPLARREEELLAWEQKLPRDRDAILKEAQRSLALSYYQIETTLAQERDRTTQLTGRIKTLTAEAHQLETRLEQTTAENTTLTAELEKWDQRKKSLPGFLRNLLRWYWKRKGLSDSR